MRSRLFAALGLVLAQFGILAQTPVKPVSQPTAKSEPASLSDQERNIQAYIQLMRSDLRNEKAQVTGAVMQLDASEAAKFWPIYKDFEGELTQVYDGVVAVIKSYVTNYENMTPMIADQLAAQILDLEQQRNDLKRRYYQKFKAGLDSITAVRFLQVENQIERVIDLQIASQLPVIDRN
jgi:hypothetical protein